MECCLPVPAEVWKLFLFPYFNVCHTQSKTALHWMNNWKRIEMWQVSIANKENYNNSKRNWVTKRAYFHDVMQNRMDVGTKGHHLQEHQYFCSRFDERELLLLFSCYILLHRIQPLMNHWKKTVCNGPYIYIDITSPKQLLGCNLQLF